MRPIIGITCTTTGSGESGSRNGIGADYINAIEHAGGTPILLPLVQNDSCIADFLGMIDGLLLSGGVDVDPFLYGEESRPAMGRIDVAKDRVEMSLISRALEVDLPILGICRGIQMLNVAAGGTLYQDISMSSNTILKHQQEAPGSYATQAVDVKEGSRLLSC
jgi:putative glutamine amidotransferase